MGDMYRETSGYDKDTHGSTISNKYMVSLYNNHGFALPPVICHSLLWNITIQVLEPYTEIIELNRPVSSVFQNYCNICVSVSNYHRVATGSS